MSAFNRVQIIRSVEAPVRGGARGWGWYHRALDKIRKGDYDNVKYDASVPVPEKPRPRAYIDISIGESSPQRLTLELANDVVPQTVDNFIKLCTTGFQSQLGSGSYKGTVFHNITKNTYLMGGDVLHQNGMGGHTALSSHEQFFPDENFALQYSERGVIGMTNSGVHRNGSQFFITLKPLPHLNGRNVAFGKIVEGTQLLDALESVYCAKGKPLTKIEISDCGIL